MLQHAQIPRRASCLPLCLCARFLVFSVTVWQCFPEVPVSHSASIGAAQATWRQVLGHLSIQGHEQWLPYQLYSPPIGQNLYPWFSAPDTIFSSEVPRSTAVPGLLALLLATASAEGSHHILTGLVLLAILLFFLAHCWGRLCSSAQSRMPYHIFGIQFPVCLCVTDLSLHLMLIWAW